MTSANFRHINNIFRFKEKGFATTGPKIDGGNAMAPPVPPALILI